MQSFLAALRSVKPFHWLILGAALFFLWLWIFGNLGLYELQKLEGIKNELKEELKTAEQEREKLLLESKRLEDSQYLEHEIRKELGYVKSNEKIIQWSPPPPSLSSPSSPASKR